MRSLALKLTLPAVVAACGVTFLSSSGRLPAQPVWPYAPPPPTMGPATPSTQRNVLNGVRAQYDWLQNATRTAPNYATGGVDLLWDQFQKLRGSFNALTMTLNARQTAQGANEIAELAAGLDIIQEAFGNYQDDVASGRPASTALRDLCQVLRQASAVWLQQLNRDCGRLRVGF